MIKIEDFYIRNGTISFAFDDVETVIDDSTLVQTVKMVIKTVNNNYFIGADLEYFIGKPNTLEIREQLKEQLFNALIRTDMFESDTLKVLVSPDSRDLMVNVLFKSIYTDSFFEISGKISMNTATLTFV